MKNRSIVYTVNLADARRLMRDPKFENLIVPLRAGASRGRATRRSETKTTYSAKVLERELSAKLTELVRSLRQTRCGRGAKASRSRADGREIQRWQPSVRSMRRSISQLLRQIGYQPEQAKPSTPSLAKQRAGKTFSPASTISDPEGRSSVKPNRRTDRNQA